MLTRRTETSSGCRNRIDLSESPRLKPHFPRTRFGLPVPSPRMVTEIRDPAATRCDLSKAIIPKIGMLRQKIGESTEARSNRLLLWLKQRIWLGCVGPGKVDRAHAELAGQTGRRRPPGWQMSFARFLKGGTAALLAVFGLAVSGGIAYADTELLAYFPFDGSPDEAARKIPTEIIGQGGEDVETVSGKYGKAYEFGERFHSAVIAAPLDIDFAGHRQVSVSAWVRLSLARTASGGYFFGTGSSSTGAPQLQVYNEDIRAGAGRSHPRHKKSLEPGIWTHVAAVWDYDQHTVRIYVDGTAEDFSELDMDPYDLIVNDRNQPKLKHPTDDDRPVQRYIVVGARTLEGYGVAEDIAVDDLRVYSGKLTPEQVEQLRTADSPPPPGPTAPPFGSETASSDDGEEKSSGKGKLRLSKDFSISSLSGDSGERTKTVDLKTAPVKALRLTQNRPQWYHPCMVKIWSEEPGNFRFRAHKKSGIRQKLFDKCSYASGTGRQLEALYQKGYYLKSLRVCQNKRKNNRIKGLQTSAVRVVLNESTGEIAFRDYDTQEVRNPNCKEWHELIRCGEGEVASGLRVRYDEDRVGVGSFTGLELVCRKVENVGD